MTWRERAECAKPGVDPRIFDTGYTAREALAVCARCPVREPCLDEATAIAAELAETTPFQLTWGGVAWDHEQRTRNHRAQCGTESGYKAHRRHHEPPCDECRAAHNRAVSKRKSRARARRREAMA